MIAKPRPFSFERDRHPNVRFHVNWWEGRKLDVGLGLVLPGFDRDRAMFNGWAKSSIHLCG